MINSSRFTKGKGLVALAVLSLTITGLATTANAESSGKGKSAENAVRKDARGIKFSNPEKIISTDADQNAYDLKESKSTDVKVVSARVFELKSQSGATKRAVSTTVNLVNHGGEILSAPKIYAIWWGPSFPAGYSSGISNYLTGSACTTLSCSGLSSLVNQYFGASKANITFGGSFTDTSSTPPTMAPTTATILSEAYTAVVTLGHQKMDPNGIYLVFTFNFPSSAGYCAWHGAGSVAGNAFTVGYMPNISGMLGCSASNLIGYKASGAGVDVDFSGKYSNS